MIDGTEEGRMVVRMCNDGVVVLGPLSSGLLCQNHGVIGDCDEIMMVDKEDDDISLMILMAAVLIF